MRLALLIVAVCISAAVIVAPDFRLTPADHLNVAIAYTPHNFAPDFTAATFWTIAILAVFTLFRLITSQKKLAQNNSDDFLQAFDNAAVGMAELDLNGHITKVNQRLCNMLGRTRQELIGRLPKDIAIEKYLGIEKTLLDRMISGEETICQIERLHIDLDNPQRPKNSIFLIRKNANTSAHFLAVITDIDDKKSSEIVENADLLKEYQTTISATLPGALCSYRQISDGSSELVFASASFEDVCGLSPNDAWQGAKDCFKRVYVDDLPRLHASISEAARNKSSWRAEYRITHPTKGQVWIEERSTPIQQLDGSILWHGVIFDVTERKRAEEALLLSKERLDHAVDIAKLGLFDHDLVTNTLFASDRFREIGGWPANHVITIPDLIASIHPDDRQLAIEKIKQAQDPAGDGQYFAEHRIIRPDGTEHWVVGRSQTAFEMKNGKREAVRVMGCILDITENVRSQEEAHRWQKLFEASGFGLAQTRVADNTFLAVNQAFAAQRGFETVELEGAPISKIYPPELISELEAKFHEIDAAGHAVYETVHQRKDGSRFPVLMEVTLVKDTSGNPTSRMAYALDISKFKQAEAALSESRQLLETTVSSLREGVMVFNAAGHILSCNPSAERILGLSFAEMQKQRPDFGAWPAIHEDGSIFKTEDFPVVRTLTTGMPCEDVVIGTRAKGPKADMAASQDVSWLLVNTAPVTDAAGKFGGSAVVSFVDITARKADERRRAQLLENLEIAQQETQRQRNLFKSIFDGAPDAILRTDLDRRILSINPVLRRMFGYEPSELVGELTRKIYATESDWTTVGNLIEENKKDKAGSGPMNIRDITFLRKNGEVFPGTISGALLRDEHQQPMGYISIIRDVTTERARDKALEESARLESLGRLTSGIAHDFNNLLTVVSVNLQLIGMTVPNEDIKRKVDAALMATNMGAKLNQRLTSMARTKRLHAVPVNLNSVIRGIHEVLRVGLGEPNALSLSLGTELHLTSVDPGEMENVLLNLAVNARDAMPVGGVLTIETRNVDADNPVSQNSAGLPAGKYVALIVRDTGTGMSPEILKRATEPFYTTKSSGSGLGLAAVSSFVKQSGGHLSIESIVGSGTTVKIHLPVFEEADRPAPMPASKPTPIRIGRAKILLVEDNREVLDAVSTYLESIGYNVIKVSDAYAALKILEQQSDIDLIFTDIVLPGGASGHDLARTVARAYPNVKVLMTSGFADQRSQNDIEYDQILKKPYALDDMEKAIAEKLASS